MEQYNFAQITFPRLIDFKKTYKWKRMNFVTDIPKRNPKVLSREFLIYVL